MGQTLWAELWSCDRLSALAKLKADRISPHIPVGLPISIRQNLYICSCLEVIVLTVTFKCAGAYWPTPASVNNALGRTIFNEESAWVIWSDSSGVIKSVSDVVYSRYTLNFGQLHFHLWQGMPGFYALSFHLLLRTRYIPRTGWIIRICREFAYLQSGFNEGRRSLSSKSLV